MPSCPPPQRACAAWRPPGLRWADGCRHVFLDLGSNRGVSIRKLFEPAAYPSDGYDWIAREVLAPAFRAALR